LIRSRWWGRFVFPSCVRIDQLEEIGNIFDFSSIIPDTIPDKARLPSIERAKRSLESSEIPYLGEDNREITGSENERIGMYAYSSERPVVKHQNDYRNKVYDEINLHAEDSNYPNISSATKMFYGIDTLRENEPVVVAEHVLDAVAAVDAGFPALAPGITDFTPEDHQAFSEVLDAHNIETVYFIQSRDSATITAKSKEATDQAERVAARQAIDRRESLLDEPSVDLQEQIKTTDELDADIPNSEMWDGGPLSSVLSVADVSSGVQSMLATELYLESRGFDVYHINLPKLAGERISWREYITSDLHEYAPPFSGISAALTQTDQDDFTNFGPHQRFIEFGSPAILRPTVSSQTEAPIADPPRTSQIPVDSDGSNPTENNESNNQGQIQLGQFENAIPTLSEGTRERPALLPSPQFEKPFEHERFEPVLKSEARRRQRAPVADQSRNGKLETGGVPALFELELADLLQQEVGEKSTNPVIPMADPGLHFKLIGKNAAYDFKHKRVYNAMEYLLIKADVRSPTGSYHEYEPEELLKAHLYAYKQGLLPDGAVVPRAALHAAAVAHDIAEWDDLKRREVEFVNGKTEEFEALAIEQYNEIVSRFEDLYGVPPGRWPHLSLSDFEIGNLTTEQSASLFASQYLKVTTEEDEQLNSDYEYPRIPVDEVFDVYKSWCREINGIEEIPPHQGSKKRIMESLDASSGNQVNVEKFSMHFDGGKTQCYKHVKFNWKGDQLRQIILSKK
jgi:hypothetical protein